MSVGSSAVPNKAQGLYTWRLLVTVFVCALGGSFQFGFGTGFVNNTVVYIHNYMFNVLGVEKDEDSFQFLWSIAVSSFGCGGLFGSFLGPAGSNHPKIGRRNAILLCNAFFITSACLLGQPQGWGSLVLGRFILGVGAGAVTGCVPIYVSEIAPKEIRGTLGTVHQLLITIGIVVAQGLTTAKFHLLGSNEMWQYTLVVPVACSLVQLAVLSFAADSPTFLYKQKGREAAKKALRYFRPSNCSGSQRVLLDENAYNLDEELNEIELELLAAQDPNSEPVHIGTPRVSSSPVVARNSNPLLCEQYDSVTLGLNDDQEKPPPVAISSAFKQLKAQSLITARDVKKNACSSQKILIDTSSTTSSQKKVGPEKIDTTTSSYVVPEDRQKMSYLWSLVDMLFFSKPSVRIPIWIGVMVNLTMQFSGIDAVLYYSTKVFVKAGIPLEFAQVCTTFVGLVNVLVTIPAMLYMDVAGRKTIQLSGLGGMCVAYAMMTFSFVFDMPKLSIFAMVLIVVFFAFGPGCIAWFIISEMIPMESRATATSLGLAVNWLANWFVAFIFPHCMVWFGNYTFLLFVVSTAVFWVGTYTFLPETKGKTVMEIQAYFIQKYDEVNTNNMVVPEEAKGYKKLSAGTTV